jgi:hypothetical protein
MKALYLCSRRTFSICLLKCIAVGFSLFAFVTVGSSQTLSANSGINPADTYVVFDLNVQSAGTVTLPDAVYSPSTQTPSTWPLWLVRCT